MNVFVYGTLLKGMERESAMIGAHYIGRGTVQAHLFDFGFYPGITEGDSQVFGELYEINEQILADLDIIEGYYQDDEDASLFVRKKIEVRKLTNNETASAFCYFFNHPIKGELIPYGDYRRHIFNQNEINE